jgi:transcriptional regulator with XRE-family HTH domain
MLGGTGLPTAQANVPRLIRTMRRRLGLTQEKFAARVGVTFPTVNRWENGKARPSPLALQKIENTLHEMGKDGADLLKRHFHERR